MHNAASTHSHDYGTADELQAARRDGWYIGIPLYSVRRRSWQLYAFDTTEWAPSGVRTRERTATGSTEDECLREMARCLRELGRKKLP
jgi:hypothetical protein